MGISAQGVFAFQQLIRSNVRYAPHCLMRRRTAASIRCSSPDLTNLLAREWMLDVPDTKVGQSPSPVPQQASSAANRIEWSSFMYSKNFFQRQCIYTGNFWLSIKGCLDRSEPSQALNSPKAVCISSRMISCTQSWVVTSCASWMPSCQRWPLLESQTWYG
jgi:hypothetical protein